MLSQTTVTGAGQSAFWTAFDRLVRAMAAAGAAVLVFATLLVLTEIVSRYFFRRPILGAVEITEYCLAWTTFLAAPWVQSRGGNVRVDFVLTSLSARNQARLNFAISIVGLLVFLVLTVVGILTVWSHYELSYALPTPLHPLSAPLIGIVPLSTLLLTIQLAREIALHFHKMSEG